MNMKTRFATTILLLVFAIFSCVGKKVDRNSSIDALKRAAEYSSMANEIDLKSEMDETYRKSLEEIEESLNSIIEMRGIVNRNSIEEGMNKSSSKEKIIEGIQVLNSLLLESERKIEQLKLQVRKGDAESETLNRIINQMERKLENENEKVMTLKAELSKRDYEIEDLTARINELESEKYRLMTNYKKIYRESKTVYMVEGTSKELKQKGIIDKQGGILSLGSVSVLNRNFSSEYFKEINMEENTMIHIYAKNIKLITEHPTQSYELLQPNDETTFLHITDPKEFWKASRYLVIQK
jgi:septal ring factor EnvC (AmiA/AmiB activator)